MRVTKHTKLIENPSGNFHHVYNLLKRQWLKTAKSKGPKRGPSGFDKELAGLLNISPHSLSQRKVEISNYSLSANEYIKISEYYRIDIEVLVRAHIS
jgi:hypothetical protein